MKSVGIVGLPNVGKSTLFNIITKQQVAAENYPFCTIDKNSGVVTIDDQRLNKLAALVQAKDVFPAPVQFVDIAGLVQGASKGEGLGNQFLSHIREVDLILFVLRGFLDPQITHVLESIDPVRDVEIVITELLLKDVESVETKIHALHKDARSGDKDAIEFQKHLEELRDSYLLKGKSAYYFRQELKQRLSANDYDRSGKTLGTMFLLTDKPAVVILNISYADYAKEEYRLHVKQWSEKVLEYLKNNVDPHASEDLLLLFDSRFVAELSSLPPEEQELLSADLTVYHGMQDVVQLVLKRLDLIFFYTGNEKDARAWPLPRKNTVLDAAALIHTDLADHFVKAQVVGVDQVVEQGGWVAARDKGIVKTVGRDYVVENGDYIVILTH